MPRRSWAVIGVLGFLFAAAAFAMFTPLGCIALGGRFGDRCFLPSCSNLGGCGKWAGPLVSCEHIGASPSKSQVHFAFGEPDEASSKVERWFFEKVPVFIEVTYFNDHASQVVCSKGPLQPVSNSQ